MIASNGTRHSSGVLPATARRRDRWADWAVVLVVVVALGLGLLLREMTLYRYDAFAVAGGDISGRVPANWLREYSDDPLLQARDPRSGAFNTTLLLRTRPLAADMDPTLALQSLALERAGAVTAYETLETNEVAVGGRAAIQRTFTYVQADRNPYVDRLPVVVKGIDLALQDEGRAIIVTYLASVDTFDEGYRYYRDFVESIEF
jgi:hypothetical protein